MSAKRLNKRQLREQQELDELANVPVHSTSAQASDDADSDVEVEEAQPVPASRKPTTTSLFAALGDGFKAEEGEQDDDEEEDEDISAHQAVKSSKKKSKKKKKKTAAAAATDPSAQADTPQHTDTPPKSNSKKSSKKASSATPAANNAKGTHVSEMSIDELDALLASQATLNSSSASASASGGAHNLSANAARHNVSRVSAYRTHLSLDPRNLDPSIELRRQFGSAALKAYASETGSSAASGARARAQANNPNLKLRTLLCTPNEHWPPITRTFTGMSMDVLESANHGRICEWKHSKAYREVQMQFLQAVRSMDPNALMALRRVYPYHIDTLLQLSEYSRHQGDLGQAGDLNDAALFALEKTAAPYFTSCLSSTTSGPPLVNFNKIENRAFYLAIHRKIGFLGRRGTWRTALEWAKLLLGLGQDGEDHHAALLWIDFLAIKSRQHRWLLELISRLDEQRSRSSHTVSQLDDMFVRAVSIVDAQDKANAGERESHSGALDWCVGLAYSRALALRAVEKEDGDDTHTRSDSALRLAIARFPAVVPLLCSKIGLDLPSKVAGHDVFQVRSRYVAWSDTLADLLTHIYVLRSESLWKEAGYGEWLRKCAMALADDLIADFERGAERKTQAAVAAKNTRLGIYRHVLVSDVPDTTRQQLIAYLPPEITADSQQMDAFDPVPPRSAAFASVHDDRHDGDDGVERQINHVTRYDDEYFAPIMRSLARNGGLAQAQEEADGGGMMQALRRAMHILGGGGGDEGGVEAWQNMDDETRDDVLAQLMHMAQRQGGMPGAFGDETQGAEQDDQAQAAQGGARGALAALRGAVDALWRGRDEHQPQHNRDEDDDDDDGDATA